MYAQIPKLPLVIGGALSHLSVKLGGGGDIIMIITAMAATTETESEGIHFTTEALYQLAKTAISKPVTNSFDFEDVVGIVLSASVIDESLVLKLILIILFFQKHKNLH